MPYYSRVPFAPSSAQGRVVQRELTAGLWHATVTATCAPKGLLTGERCPCHVSMLSVFGVRYGHVSWGGAATLSMCWPRRTLPCTRGGGRENPRAPSCSPMNKRRGAARVGRGWVPPPRVNSIY